MTRAFHHRRITIFMVLVLLAIVAAAAVTVKTREQRSVKPIPVALLNAHLAEFVGTPIRRDITWQRETMTLPGAYWTMIPGVGSFDADQVGHITDAVFMLPPPDLSKGLVSQQTAQRNAETFLASHSVDISTLTLLSVGTANARFDFAWRKLIGEVVTLGRVEVVIDRAGRTAAFHHQEPPVTAPTHSRIAKADAIKIAELSAPDYTVLSAEPQLVIIAPRGQQILVWQVTLTTALDSTPTLVDIFVDATTGTVLS